MRGALGSGWPVQHNTNSAIRVVLDHEDDLLPGAEVALVHVQELPVRITQ